jgi:hypothetical protein
VQQPSRPHPPPHPPLRLQQAHLGQQLHLQQVSYNGRQLADNGYVLTHLNPLP